MMRALRFLAMVAMVLLLSGCNRGWTCWWLRGDPCTSCGTTAGETAPVVPPAQLPEPIP